VPKVLRRLPGAFLNGCFAAPDCLLRQDGTDQDIISKPFHRLCSGCRTCAARCPNGIDISALNDRLKYLARERRPAAEKGVQLFHRAFLASVKQNGRVHEIGVVFSHEAENRRLAFRCQAGLGYVPPGPNQSAECKNNRPEGSPEAFRRAGEGG
jgi:heterodisulfide reductase subunit C